MLSYEEFSRLLIVVMLCGFAVVISLEFAIPAAGKRRSSLAWLRHTGRNLSLWLFNTTFLRFTIGAGPLLTAIWADQMGVGVFNLIGAPAWLVIPLGILAIDFFDYLLHRIMHNVRPLWLLHAVHHSDRELDVTTNLRAHPLQTIVIMSWKTVVTLGLGLSTWSMLIRELLVMPVAQLHHANIRWPEALDRLLRPIIVTPAMHRLHHSPELRHTNSNYGELFSFWDRLLGTYRWEEATVRGPFGLHNLQDEGWHSIWGMLKTPFAARRFQQL